VYCGLRQIDSLAVVPAIAIQLAKSPAVDNYDLSFVREIVCGTAPLPHEVEKLLLQRFPGLILRQGIHDLIILTGLKTNDTVDELMDPLIPLIFI